MNAPFLITNELFFFIIGIVMVGVGLTTTLRILKGTKHDTAFTKLLAWQGAGIGAMIAAFDYDGITWLTWSYFITLGVLAHIGTKYYRRNVDGSAVLFAFMLLSHAGIVLGMSIELFRVDMLLASAMTILSGVLITLGSTVALSLKPTDVKLFMVKGNQQRI